MKTRALFSTILAVSLLAVIGLGGVALVTGLTPTVQAAPSCEVQCKKDFKQCQRFCGQPDINCLVACETILDACLGNCGAITQ